MRLVGSSAQTARTLTSSRFPCRDGPFWVVAAEWARVATRPPHPVAGFRSARMCSVFSAGPLRLELGQALLNGLTDPRLVFLLQLRLQRALRRLAADRSERACGGLTEAVVRVRQERHEHGHGR